MVRRAMQYIKKSIGILSIDFLMYCIALRTIRSGLLSQFMCCRVRVPNLYGDHFNMRCVPVSDGCKNR